MEVGQSDHIASDEKKLLFFLMGNDSLVVQYLRCLSLAIVQRPKSHTVAVSKLFAPAWPSLSRTRNVHIAPEGGMHAERKKRHCEVLHVPKIGYREMPNWMQPFHIEGNIYHLCMPSRSYSF